MKDLISRQAAIDEFYMDTCDVDKVAWAENVLKRVPTAERKGHWYKNSTLINCSVCKHCSWSVNAYEDLVKTFKYCPNCGARMESE